MKKSELVFQVERIVFSRDGFCIVRTVRGQSVSGKFNAKEGLCFKAQGEWDETSPKAVQFGATFKVDSAVMIRLPSPEAVGRFLIHSLRGKGKGSSAVGESVIANLVASVKEQGLDLEDILDRGDRDTLVECMGARNKAKADTILEWWVKLKPAADLMTPLLNYGLTAAMCETLLTLYGKKAIEVVETRPYDLITRVEGVSFLKADAIAKKVGRIQLTDSIRLRAALATGMQDATTNGDIGVRRKNLLEKTMPLVNEAVVENGRRKLAPGVPPEVSLEFLAGVLDDMVKGVYTDSAGEECEFSSKLVEFPDAKGELVVWSKDLLDYEESIAKRLTRFNAAPRHDLIAEVPAILASMKLTLAPEQQAAVEMALTNPVSVITGGPGCGKTTIIKVILAALDKMYVGRLAAPTGKAAKRITESSGRPAQTQHSLIGFGGPTSAAFDEHNPLTADYLVLDESSMSDTELTARTLKAAKNSCRVIFVGDVDQLPSVGPGQVLRDLIRSGVLPVTKLTKGFRFGGSIAEAARTINAGQIPDSSEDGAFTVVDTDTPAQDLLDAFKKLVDSGVNPDEIQVLAPTHKGEAGCEALNRAVQGYLNPEPRGGTTQRLKRDSGDIRVSDRVIQTKNNKQLGIVNGDVGWITDLSGSEGLVSLMLTDREKPLGMSSADAQHLKLAYAITVHKSQGAEAPYVLIALDRSAAFMLRRNLVYTAATRGSKKVMIFSARDTLARAVRMGEPAEGSRRTNLVSYLHEHFPERLAKAASTTDAIAEAMRSDEFPDLPF